jgi:hypothetical protein
MGRKRGLVSDRKSGKRKKRRKLSIGLNCCRAVAVNLRKVRLAFCVAGSSPTEDGGFLRVIKIPSAHFLRTGSKAVGPMSYRFTACKRTLHSMSEMLCRANFLSTVSHPLLLLRYQMALVVESG